MAGQSGAHFGVSKNRSVPRFTNQATGFFWNLDPQNALNVHSGLAVSGLWRSSIHKNIAINNTDHDGLWRYEIRENSRLTQQTSGKVAYIYIYVLSLPFSHCMSVSELASSSLRTSADLASTVLVHQRYCNGRCLKARESRRHGLQRKKTSVGR